MRPEYRWYSQPRLNIDRRSFPRVQRGTCRCCERRRKVETTLTCQLCRDMLDSPLMGHVPGAERWPEERAGPG